MTDRVDGLANRRLTRKKQSPARKKQSPVRKKQSPAQQPSPAGVMYRVPFEIKFEEEEN